MKATANSEFRTRSVRKNLGALENAMIFNLNQQKQE
jgi:hypothetical protein